MKTKDIKEQIKIMQAYADGKEIEVMSLYAYESDWDSRFKPTWNWAQYDYRIKNEEPEFPKLYEAIFKEEELLYKPRKFKVLFLTSNSGIPVECLNMEAHTEGVKSTGLISCWDREHWKEVKFFNEQPLQTSEEIKTETLYQVAYITQSGEWQLLEKFLSQEQINVIGGNLIKTGVEIKVPLERN